jgi:hypothetical protein
MAEPDKRPVTMEELLVSSLAQTDALAKLLIVGAKWGRIFTFDIQLRRLTPVGQHGESV